MKRHLDLALHFALLLLAFGAGYEYGSGPHKTIIAAPAMPPAIVDHEAIAKMRPNKENCR